MTLLDRLREMPELRREAERLEQAAKTNACYNPMRVLEAMEARGKCNSICNNLTAEDWQAIVEVVEAAKAVDSLLRIEDVASGIILMPLNDNTPDDALTALHIGLAKRGVK